MNQQIENVNYRWLTEPTGDPFVDAGGYALEEFAKRYPDKDILELIEEVSKIYVNRWDANIYNFFLNSKITQPAFKGGRKIEETMKYFRELIEGKETVGKGICRITGQKTELFPAGRNNSVMHRVREHLSIFIIRSKLELWYPRKYRFVIILFLWLACHCRDE